MEMGVNKTVEKMFITPDMPKILKEILHIQSVVGQGIDKLCMIIFN
jgi:hypothetical protein